MSDQKPNQETQNPEYVSLESRFGINEDDFKSELNEGSEKVWERGPEQKDEVYQRILDKVVDKENNEIDESTLMQDASVLHQQVDKESQITHLIDLAMTKGVGHAVKVARKTEDNYVLDQLHDRLSADELHDKLKSKGLIK